MVKRSRLAIAAAVFASVCLATPASAQTHGDESGWLAARACWRDMRRQALYEIVCEWNGGKLEVIGSVETVSQRDLALASAGRLGYPVVDHVTVPQSQTNVNEGRTRPRNPVTSTLKARFAESPPVTSSPVRPKSPASSQPRSVYYSSTRTNNSSQETAPPKKQPRHRPGLIDLVFFPLKLALRIVFGS